MSENWKKNSETATGFDVPYFPNETPILVAL
jgi:hypothetical protein